MTPQNLGVQVTGTSLRRLPSRLDSTLQDDHNLKSILKHIRSRHMKQWRIRIDPMHHNHWPDKEQIRRATIRADLQLCLVLAQDLSFSRLFRFDKLCPNVRSDDVTFTHISNSEHQGQLSVTLTYDSISREEERLGALFGPSHLGKDNSNHKSLHHNSVYGLEAHHENGFGTFLGGRSDTVANRVLSFDGE